MRAEKTQRSRAAKWTEAPALRQSGVRAASPPPSDEESPGPGRAAGLCPRAAHRSLRRPPRNRERRGPAGRSRRGTPGRAGRWGALESERGRGGSRFRGGVALGATKPPRRGPRDRRSARRGHRLRLRPRLCSRSSRLGSPLPPPQIAYQNLEGAFRTCSPQPPRLTVRVVFFYRLIRPYSSGPGLRWPKACLASP